MQILFLAGFVFLITRPYVFEPSGALLIKPLSGSDVRSVLRADIDEIYVEDGQYVEKGMLLAKLSDIEEVKNIGAIEARIKQLEAKLAVARQGAKVEEIALARQQLTTADARLKFSSSQAARYAELIETQLVSQQQYENAEAEKEVDAERVEEARRNLELVESGSREEELDVIIAQLAEQQVDLDYFNEKLDRTRLKATSSGHVVSGTLDYAVGDYLDLGELLLRIEDTSQVIAEVAISESDIGDVEIGAQARVKIWQFPDREFRGQVDTIAPTAEIGDYGKVVLVRILLPNSDDVLRAGFTGHGKIIGPEMPAYQAFTRAIVRFFRIEVWSWLP
jgi:multidrug resistance efflux pump